MTVSPNLEIINVSEAQSNKATTVNTALLAIEQALTDQLVVATTGGDVVLPYSNLNDMSIREALRCVSVVLQTGATAPFNVIHPAKKHLFFIKNETSQTATVKTPTGAGVTVLAGKTLLLYCNGANVENVRVSDPEQSNFLGLADTPTVYTDQAGKMLVVNGTATGLVFAALPAKPSFLTLDDTPAAFTDQSGKILAVNAAATGLVFIDPPQASEPPSTDPEFVTQSTARNLTNDDLSGRRIMECLNTADMTITIPAGLAGLGPLNVIQASTGVVSFAAATGVTLKSAAGTNTAAQNGLVTIIPRGDDVYYLVGMIST